MRYDKLSYAIKSNLITLLGLITLVYKSYNFTVKSLPEKTNKSEPAIAIVRSSPVQLSQVVAASSQSRESREKRRNSGMSNFEVCQKRRIYNIQYVKKGESIVFNIMQEV